MLESAKNAVKKIQCQYWKAKFMRVRLLIDFFIPDWMRYGYKMRNYQKGSKMAAESKMATKNKMATKKIKTQMIHVLRGFKVKNSDKNVSLVKKGQF